MALILVWLVAKDDKISVSYPNTYDTRSRDSLSQSTRPEEAVGGIDPGFLGMTIETVNEPNTTTD
jgi:hypothetical protein